MKIKSRLTVILSLILVICCFGSLITFASTSCPDKSSVYSNDTDHSVYGTASRSSLFTNKCFHGVTSISYDITNDNSKSLKVKLGRYWSGSTNCFYGIQSFTVSANGSNSGSFDDLDEDYYYFIEFCAPSDFSGTVCGNS